MIRKAIIIGGASSKRSGNFPEGVDLNLHYFRKFLKSPAGGSWEDSEIVGLYNCSSERLFDTVRNTDCDYLLLYFSGHGKHYLSGAMISVNETEEIIINELISSIRVHKALLIIDIYDKSTEGDYSNMTGKEYPAFDVFYNQPNSADRYKQLIADCDAGITVAWGSSVGEIANETEFGGVFTYSLLNATLDWYDRAGESVLTIHEASDLSYQYINSEPKHKQTPQVRSTNDGRLKFPFAIKYKYRNSDKNSK